MTNYGTNFTETEALLAAQERDYATVDKILSQMTDTELEALRKASQYLFMQVQLWQRSGGIPLDQI